MMLANPVLIPAYADPFHWFVALIAMGCELGLVYFLLRRRGIETNALGISLFVMNIVTWFCFLFAVDTWHGYSGMIDMNKIALLELVVVVTEAYLINQATSGRFFSRNQSSGAVGFGRALFVSMLGNSLSVVVSVALVFGLIMTMSSS